MQHRIDTRLMVLGALGLALTASPARADVLFVPGDHPTIQGAIEAASNGDVIRVSPGVYLEHDLHVANLDVTIESALGPEVTWIDAGLQGRVLVASGNNVVTLSGVTLTRGRAGTECPERMEPMAILTVSSPSAAQAEPVDPPVEMGVQCSF